MSKTKEQILEKCDAPTELTRGTEIVCFNAAIQAMEEYALQEMSSFSKWASASYSFCPNDNCWYSRDEKDDNSYTTEELSQRYYESIKE